MQITDAAIGSAHCVASLGHGACAGNSARAHAPATVGGAAYAYDANGNATSGGSRTYTWDGNNQPTGIVGPDSVTETYGYDADGARISRARAGVTTVYFANLVEVDFQSGMVQLIRDHLILQGKVVAQFFCSFVDSTSVGTIYLHGDHLGSVSVVTDDSGGVISRQAFAPWGALRPVSGDIPQTTLDFTGQQKDATGLLFYHARYYDPQVGRFTSADTVAPAKEQPQGRNRYSYVLNNPLKYTDPTGHYEMTTKELLPPGHLADDRPDSADPPLRADGCSFVNTDACQQLAQRMWDELGIVIDDLWTTWTLGMAQLIYDSAILLRNALGSNAAFQAAMGRTVHIRFGATPDNAPAAWYGSLGRIHVTSALFASGDIFAKRTVIHELAHIWDSAHAMSRRMANYLAAYGEDRRYPSDYARGNRTDPWGHIYGSEDFAESVAVYLTSHSNNPELVPQFYGSNRWQFLSGVFCQAGNQAECP